LAQKPQDMQLNCQLDVIVAKGWKIDNEKPKSLRESRKNETEIKLHCKKIECT